MSRRAPRAVRRGRKFRGRPTSHDGLSVIAAYGNRAGMTRQGRVAGRVGYNAVVCRDGYALSVAAGFEFLCVPKVLLGGGESRIPGWVGPDYRGPYVGLEIYGWSEPRFECDPPRGEAAGPVPVWLVRALVDMHGGFHRMLRHNSKLRFVRRSAALRAEQGTRFC